MNGPMATLEHRQLGMCMNIYLCYPVWADGKQSGQGIGVAAATRCQAARQALAHLRGKGMPEQYLSILTGFTVQHIGTVARAMEHPNFPGVELAA